MSWKGAGRMNIEVLPIEKHELKPLYRDVKSLGFGKIFTDRMFTMWWTPEKGWHDARIEKYHDFSLDPAAIVLHYGQEIFEGLKAFCGPEKEIFLFRPEKNVQRFNRSARRLCMPEIPEKDMLEAIETLVRLESRWLPEEKGAALYIRPTMIATETGLGVRAANRYLFFIILSPVGPYYPEGFKPIRLYVTEDFVRAAPGGVGEAKCGGNYAASLLAGQQASQKGFSQVLWLDSKEHKYVEEVGAMNIFFVYDDTIVTPRLNGSILHGITRDSIIRLATSLGYQVEETRISIEEVCHDIRRGILTEVFGSGTAASVAPVGALSYRGKLYKVNDEKIGRITREMYDRLQAIQYGEAEDTFGWRKQIGKKN